MNIESFFRSVRFFSLFFIFFLISAVFFRVNAIDVNLIVDPELVGDCAQGRGVVRALKAHFSEMTLKEVEEISQLENDLKKDAATIIIGVGNKGATKILELRKKYSQKEFPKLQLIHLSHQRTNHHANLVGQANIIVLPSHAVDSFFRDFVKKSSSQLLETVGVCHNLTQEELALNYEKIKKKIPSDKPSYLGIILAGDAPESDGTMLYYTSKEAQEFAHLIAKDYPSAHLLILNGPRTGKHDPSTGKVLKNAHRGEVDLVSQAFVSALEENGFKADENFTLFDFQVENNPQVEKPSDYKGILGFFQKNLQNKPFFLVPGESTTMISECIDVLPLGSVAIYTHAAMNKTHHQHVLSENEAGRTLIFGKEEALKKSGKPPPSASETVAQAIANFYKTH